MFDTSSAPVRTEVLATLRRQMGALAPGGDRAGTQLRQESASVAAPAGLLAVPQPLADVLPRGGLPRGGVVSLTGGQGSTSLLLTLLAAPQGAWSVVVGIPEIGLLAAAEFGVDLDRLALIPNAGPDILQVLSILSDGVDMVAVGALHGRLASPSRLRVLTGLLRQRGAVLLVAGSWPGADLILGSRLVSWSGLGSGFGRLRDRELLIEVGGRGAAGRKRSVVMALRSTRSSVQVTAGSTVAPAAVHGVDRGYGAEVG